MTAIVTRFVENVTVPAHRLRSLNAESVETIAESFRRLGQQTPITLRETDDGDLILIAGLHRLEAARRLGWDRVDAVLWEGSETDARLWEIAENLHRADLSETQRRQQIAEWVRLTAESEVSTHDAEKLPRKGVGRGSGGGRPEEAISKAAKDLGISRDTVSRAVAAESLTSPVKAAADAAKLGTVARAAVAKEHTPEQQIAKVREIAERKPVKPAPAPLNDIETEEQWITAFMRVWNRGAPQWRERALREVDTPIFDCTAAA